MDEKWNVYKAMGKRTLNMDTLKAGVQKLMPRYKSKGIPMRFEGGDRFVMGGILIFNRRGDLRYAYEEAYGEELDMQVIEDAIKDVRGQGSSLDPSSFHSVKESRRQAALEVSSHDSSSSYSLATSSLSQQDEDLRFL